MEWAIFRITFSGKTSLVFAGADAWWRGAQEEDDLDVSSIYRDLYGPRRIVLPDGRQEWRLGWKLHRDDGPAVIYPDGTQEWWVNGVKVK